MLPEVGNDKNAAVEPQNLTALMPSCCLGHFSLWLRGEPRVSLMVPVPDEADEDARRCVRERTEPISERRRTPLLSSPPDP